MIYNAITFGDDLMKLLLFVYGTLMKGRCNDHYLREEKYLGIGRLKNYEMYHVSTYPGIIEGPGGYVVGELYEIDEATLKSLDVLEDEGNLFNRKQIQVSFDGDLLDAYAYIWNNKEDVKSHKVVDMPWEPLLYDSCRSQLRPLDSETGIEAGTWPLIIELSDGRCYEACTIRGIVAAVVGESYLANEKKEQDWHQRVKYAFDNIMADEKNLHIVIKDQTKGVVAENCCFDIETPSNDVKKPTEIINIETERGFLYSIARLGHATIYERENERYLTNWKDDGNNVAAAKEVVDGKYINIKSYDLEDLISKTWDEL